MKRLIPSLGLFCMLLASSGFAQSLPLDQAEILGRLAQGCWPSYVAYLVKTRGVSFSWSPDFVERVKLAGGEGILVGQLFASDASEPSHFFSHTDAFYDHLAKCTELIHQGGIEQAEHECRASIEENPKSPWPLIATAKVLQLEFTAGASPESAKKKQEERAKLLRHAAALAPNIASVHRDLAPGLPPREAMTELQAASSLDNQRLELSEGSELTDQIQFSMFRPREGRPEIPASANEPVNIDPELQRRIQIEPNLASNHVFLALRNLQVGNLETAQSELREAIRLEPDNPVLHQSLAGYYFSQRNQEACLAELHENVRIVPFGMMPRMVVAGVLEEFGRTPEAIEELRSLLIGHPAAAEPSDGLVEIYLEHQDRKSAIAELRRSLKASALTFANEAEFVEARFQDEERLADLLKENRELEASAEQYLFLLRFNPNYLRLHNEYGNVLMEERHLDEAISEFLQAVDLNPDDADSQIFLGTALAQNGDLDRAREQFQEVIAKNPEDLARREQIGYAYMQLKDEPDAINELKRALEIQPNSAQAVNNLAWIYATALDRNLRNPREALALARQAVESSPQPNADFLDTLAEALLLNGQAGEALTIEKQAFEINPQNPEVRIRLDHFREAAEQATRQASAHQP
jgi:tetratricopeptide (TPR) repeat protein